MFAALVSVFGTVVLFVICLLGFAAPWIRLSSRKEPLESITVGIGLSVFVIYLVTFLFYCMGWSWAWLWGVVVVALVSLLVHARMYFDLFRNEKVALVTGAYVFVVLWCLGLLGFVQCYHGGGWIADWNEHYDRSLYFLERYDVDFTFIGLYHMTARPPLANLFNSFFMGLLGSDFFVFQIINTLASTLVFWAVALVLSLFCTGRQFSRGCVLLAIVFSLNPMFIQNAVFAWTKLLAVFFVFVALYFFAQSWKKEEDAYPLSLLGFLSLAVGALVHYSVLPYGVVFCVLYFGMMRHRLRDKSFYLETLIIGVTCCGVLLTWLSWGSYHFGFAKLFLTNTAVTDSVGLSFGDNVMKIGKNIFNSWVPYLIRPIPEESLEVLNFRNADFRLRDSCFLLYQHNMLWGIGSVSLMFLLIQLRKCGRWFSDFSWARSPWFLLFLGTTIISIGSHGSASVFGLAHVSSQPIVYCLLIWIVARLARSNRFVLGGALVCMGIDFYFGIFIHFNVMNVDFYALIAEFSQRGITPKQMFLEFGNATVGNFFNLHNGRLQFLGALLAWNAKWFWMGMLLLFAAFCWLMRKHLRGLGQNCNEIC